jgi:hypothetical protein
MNAVGFLLHFLSSIPIFRTGFAQLQEMVVICLWASWRLNKLIYMPSNLVSDNYCYNVVSFANQSMNSSLTKDNQVEHNICPLFWVAHLQVLQRQCMAIHWTKPSSPNQSLFMLLYTGIFMLSTIGLFSLIPLEVSCLLNNPEVYMYTYMKYFGTV